MRCCFYGDEAGRYGHNPAPVRKTGRCCARCNFAIVIPTRLYLFGRAKEKQK